MTSCMDRLLDLALIEAGAFPARARRLAELSLFDWIGVALAGVDQPVSRMVREQALAEGGAAVASVAGTAALLPARAAAMVNGTTSHALDYDDTHFGHIGHLSVGIYPAALAAAEEQGASAAALRDAFLVGAEGACRLGMVLGRGHYQRGFHQTATAGAFGATIAAGRLLGLDRARLRSALSLVSTRASGLKSQFGTMGKPFNAGMSASNGIEAVSLARRGMISCDDGIEGPQGFVETHADAPGGEGPWGDPPPGHFVFERNSYKLHACCHGTHAMIEALAAARREGLLALDAARRIAVSTHPRWLKVCDIKAPRTGLEVKFSYAWLAAMVAAGVDTSSERLYTDSLCSDPDLTRLAGLVEVTGDETLSDTQAVVTVLDGGGHLSSFQHDLDAPQSPSQLERGLRAKSQGLIGQAKSTALWQAVANIGQLPASAFGAMLQGRPSGAP